MTDNSVASYRSRSVPIDRLVWRKSVSSLLSSRSCQEAISKPNRRPQTRTTCPSCFIVAKISTSLPSLARGPQCRASLHPSTRSTFTRNSMTSMNPLPANDPTAIGPAIGQPSSRTAAPSLPNDATSSRPLTSRSHRRLVTSSVRQWVFLPTHEGENASTPRVARRPATARDKLQSSTSVGSPLTPQRPQRPHTSRPRGSTSISTTSKPNPLPSSTVVSGEFTRVMQEAAQREAQQENYVDPLLGRGVDLRIDSLLPQARATTASASNRREQHRARALQARARGDYHLAIQHFEKLLDVSFSHGDSVFFHLAVAYERVGRLEDAATMYQRAIDNNPSNPFAYYNAGNICMRMGKLSNAITYYTSAIQHGHSLPNPQQLAFYRQRGAAYRKNGEFEKAAQDYVWLRQEAAGTTPRRSVVGRSRAGSAPSQAKDSTRSRALSRAQTIGTRIDGKKSDPMSAKPQSISHKSQSVLRTAAKAGDKYTGTVLDGPGPRVQDADGGDPYARWKHEQMLNIATKDAILRSQDELLFLVDYLQLRFPTCAALHHEVCLQLCQKVVAVELTSDVPVFCERDGGRGSVYFVCHGCVSVYVTRAVPLSERTCSNQDEREVDKNQEQVPLRPLSWETGHQDDRAIDPASVTAAVTESWRQTQMHLCDLGAGAEFGHQGRHSSSPRSHSAVPASDVTLLALSWSDLLEMELAQRAAEQATLARFLRRTTLFSAASAAEIDQLSLRARQVKIVGSKVLCSEGQFVGGLVVVKEGELCQLCPSGLPLPPDLSIAFNLCGSLHSQPHQQEQSALEFFTQLEHADDPLGFLEISRVFHGFLPCQFLADRLAALRDLTAARGGTEGANARVLAKAVRRGEFFCASSSWVPFARVGEGGRGVSCAKTALVSRVSSEVLFFSARDLSETLSPETRMTVHREIQAASSLAEDPRSVLTPTPSATRGTVDASTPFFLSDKRTSDLVEQARRDDAWGQYKQRLMDELADRKARRRCQSAR